VLYSICQRVKTKCETLVSNYDYEELTIATLYYLYDNAKNMNGIAQQYYNKF